ncbi:MAG: ATPase [Anaerolineae bacterium]|jgi:cell division septum initiation protein DivIVA
MDILHLLDRMEEIIKDSRRVPFGDLRLVDVSRIWPLLDQMRISVPDELRRAERIVHERERTRAQAKEEAERIVELARQEAAQLAADHNIARSADQEAAAIRDQARQEARQIVSGADEYAFDVLCDLEQELKRALTVIENGIRAVEARRAGQAGLELVEPDDDAPPQAE